MKRERTLLAVVGAWMVLREGLPLLSAGQFQLGMLVNGLGIVAGFLLVARIAGTSN